MSEELIECYRKIHTSDPRRYAGLSTLNYSNLIGGICRRFKTRSLLDYGSGSGVQYMLNNLHRLWGMDVTCYDPAVSVFRKKPERTFDMVICCDVLEHLEPDEVHGAILEIDSYADKAVFASISLLPSKHVLPGGRNAHTCIKPREWWTKMVIDRKSRSWHLAWKTGWSIEYNGEIKE